MRKKITLAILNLVLAIATYAQNYDIGQIALHISNSEYEIAKDSLQKALSINPEDDALWYYMGMCQQATGENSKGIESYKKAIELDPSNSLYYEYLFNAYSLSRQTMPLADSLALEMKQRFPKKYNTPYMLTLLADSEVRNGQDSLAISHLEEAISIDENYGPAIISLAELRRMNGQMSSYFMLIPKFLSLSEYTAKDKVDYMNKFINLLDGQTVRIYRKQLDNMVDILAYTHPTDTLALTLAARWYYTMGEKDKSEEYFEKVTEITPESMDAYFALAFLNKEDAEKRMDIYKQALNNAKTPEDKSTIYCEAASLYHELGNSKECYKYMKSALKFNPDNATALNNYAYFLSLKKKSLSKALKMSQKAVELEPENTSFLDTYGYILYLRKRYEEAKAVFKKCMVYGGKDSKEILLHYSMTLEALGETSLANFYKNLYMSK